MISSKSTQNFWSQFLLSMIAIFALPNAQGIENTGLACENYSREQRQTQQLACHQLVAHKQIIQQRQKPTKNHFVAPKILHQKAPHFIFPVLRAATPIRAGPVA
ncbi:secA translation cis-regulator SecM [Avibacterium sp. 21-595]|uniref:secA translation cis-regulator SecM n=1 Tax=Avibacterium sp. 21-595 TaxID=2911527 RepID=UPI002026A74D|nr:secA translation cis-regulator SecM [Avibacterium sp. 21-595]URL07020.1 secA translation cis-regulator SecM [Avibacterium sp. 21-595]